MKVIQSTGKIDTEGRLSLDHPIPGSLPSSVRVIVLFEEMEAGVDQINESQLVQDVKQEIFQERQQNRK